MMRIMTVTIIKIVRMIIIIIIIIMAIMILNVSRALGLSPHNFLVKFKYRCLTRKKNLPIIF